MAKAESDGLRYWMTAEDSQNADGQRKVVELLGEVGGPAAVHALVGLLRDESPHMRVLAAGMLGTIGDRSAISPLAEVLVTDGAWEVVGKAADALGALGGPDAIEVLSEAMTSQSEDVRVAASFALTRRMKDPAALGPLVQLLSHSDPVVRGCAVETLRDLEDRRAFEPLALVFKDDPVEEVRCKAAFALALLDGDSAVPILLQALKHERSAAIRVSAIWGLGAVHVPFDIDALIDALEDENEEVVREAASVLSSTGDVRAVEPMISALQRSDSSFLKSELVSSLANLSGLYDRRVSLAIAWALFDDDDEELREAARIVVNSEHLLEWATDSNTRSDLRCIAAQAMGRIGDSSDIAALMRALDTEKDAAVWKAIAGAVLRLASIKRPGR